MFAWAVTSVPCPAEPLSRGPDGDIQVLDKAVFAVKSILCVLAEGGHEYSMHTETPPGTVGHHVDVVLVGRPGRTATGGGFVL